MNRYPAHSAEQSLRSVFVGNIAYAVTEEELTDLFKTVGPVVKFRLVRDRDTGKPKGFGFCEYHDVQTAEAAIRNLNNFELHGRPLKVDSAVNSANDKHGPDEFLTQTCAIEGGPEVFDDDEVVYGPKCDSSQCLETITSSVTSMPADKMFEVMKEMKDLAQTDPEMCKGLLDTNPQLSYALLELLVVMRTINARDAVSMLHPEGPRLDYPFYKKGANDESDIFGGAYSKPLPDRIDVTSHRTLLRNPPPVETQVASNAFPSSVANTVSAPAPMLQSPQLQPEPAKTEDEEEESAQLLVQLLQLSDEQIAMLPMEDQDKIRELRAQLRNI